MRYIAPVVYYVLNRPALIPRLNTKKKILNKIKNKNARYVARSRYYLLVGRTKSLPPIKSSRNVVVEQGDSGRYLLAVVAAAASLDRVPAHSTDCSNESNGERQLEGFSFNVIAVAAVFERDGACHAPMPPRVLVAPYPLRKFHPTGFKTRRNRMEE